MAGFISNNRSLAGHVLADDGNDREGVDLIHMEAAGFTAGAVDKGQDRVLMVEGAAKRLSCDQ